MAREHKSAAVRITTAAESPAAEQAGRQRRYLMAMAVRTACFLGAVFVGPGWLRWVLFAGAVVLPYVAVVMANAVRTRPDGVALVGPSSQVPEIAVAEKTSRKSDPSGF